eukprot:CAMPEP_0173420554 /NCGR_PEP_ID=MMETSP1357-20121228/1978_1 /TAXON_ID=77926 /ORGANISM="Hemiselmis rufescens, Strain PCC563" /LENGTH=1085 /DNA_ID=CAMNT_0014383351 /DNA_START=39 /DNA_END=3296 /DNA_ORIENTATION=+
MAEASAEPKSHARRDTLIGLQKKAQQRWEAEKPFELDAPLPGTPEAEQPKHFVTFPYPYMNGTLHLGHTFSLTKTEFSMGYERLKGKRTLWPFGFHCTGMPIQAAADNLRRDIISMYNSVYDEEAVAAAEEAEAAKAEAAKEAAADAVADPTKFKGAKTKVAAKKGKGNQWQTLEAMGIPRDIIPRFVDPVYWLQYFPPIAKDDLIAMGVKVDWRRSFITTSVNPYYDSFISWQFEKLRKKEKVSFGKRYSVFSPCDGQICADHDRASGEGVGPQEYTLIKMRVMELPPCMEQLKGSDVFLLAATLRPETMYGQTNCWMLPHDKEGNDVWYGCYRTHVEGEVVVVGERAAQNMAFQELSPKFGEVDLICKVKGRDLMGLPLDAPFTSYKPIYTLPMLTISMKKGTGVVTSVPSDAPDDYIALQDLKKKPALREKYGIKDEWVIPFEIIPIIEIPYTPDNAAPGTDPTVTDVAAVVACEEYKVASQNDKDKLALAKAKTYKLGFYEGKMCIGDFKGMSVQDAKNSVKDQLLASGGAYKYAEPEKEVMSRSGNECVVALTDQWYIKYGEDQWKAQVEAHMKRMNLYNEDVRTRFEVALGWLGEWGCSRSFGLGTLLPWDKQFVIESLSDSTVYMAYYTFCHLLQTGPFDGSVPGEANILAPELTEEVWDYVMLNPPPPAHSKIPIETLNKLKREFHYWYPVDLRVSGKDLIQNHLTFFLYNHAAIFPEEYMPQAIRTNGHVLLNGEKMSKSTGNFKTLKQALEEYSADAMRFALALAGDSNEDANFEHTVANAAILKLTNELQFIKTTLEAQGGMRTGPLELFVDRVFENEINRYIKSSEACYELMNYREVVVEAWDKLQNARDKYRAMVGPHGMHRDLILSFIRKQTLIMSPFIPHYAEHVWEVLGHKESVMAARWPEAGHIDPILIRQVTYFDKVLSDARSKVEKARVKGAVAKATWYIADSFLDWQQATLGVLQGVHDRGESFGKDFKKGLLSNPALVPYKSHSKMLMPFAAYVLDDYAVRGPEAFELKMPFDEGGIWADSLEYVKKELGLEHLEISAWSDLKDEALLKKLQPATPGKPTMTWV